MKHWFSIVSVCGMLGLGVLCLLLTGQNRELRAALAERDDVIALQAGETGLRTGDRVGALSLFDREGAAVELDFVPGSPVTVVLFTSSGCGACEVTLPRWEEMLSQDMVGARVIGIDASARDASSIEERSAMFRTLGTTNEQVGWLREIPLSPAVLVIDPSGVIRGAWYGQRAAGRTEEIRGLVMDLSAGT